MDGKVRIYFPKHPGKQYKLIDTLTVEGSNGIFEMYFRIGEERYALVPPPGHTNDTPSGYSTVAPTGKNVIIDTIDVENPDGSIQRFFRERKVGN